MTSHSRWSANNLNIWTPCGRQMSVSVLILYQSTFGSSIVQYFYILFYTNFCVSYSLCYHKDCLYICRSNLPKFLNSENYWLTKSSDIHIETFTMCMRNECLIVLYIVLGSIGPKITENVLTEFLQKKKSPVFYFAKGKHGLTWQICLRDISQQRVGGSH